MKVSGRNLINVGLLVYLCGIYLGNTEKIVCIAIYVLLTFWAIKTRKQSSYTKHQLMFCVYLCTSFIWTHKMMMNQTIAILEIATNLAVLYTSILLYQIINNEKDIIGLINILLISLVFLTVYLLMFTPRESWGTYQIGSNLGLNKNEIAINYAWGCIFCFYMIRERKIKRHLYFFLLVIFGTISLIAGSRTGAIVLIGGIILYLIFSEKNVKVFKNIGLAAGILIGGYLIIMSIPALNNLLGDRLKTLLLTLNKSSTVSAQVDKSIWERSYYRRYALQMFSETPFTVIFGHGLDGFRTRMAEIGYNHVTYSHCNYTEMLANYGLIGFILYYLYKFCLLIKTWCFKHKKKLTTLSMIILAVGMIMEYGVVSYYGDFIQFCYIIAFLDITKGSSQISEQVFKIHAGGERR